MYKRRGRPSNLVPPLDDDAEMEDKDEEISMELYNIKILRFYKNQILREIAELEKIKQEKHSS